MPRPSPSPKKPPEPSPICACTIWKPAPCAWCQGVSKLITPARRQRSIHTAARPTALMLPTPVACHARSAYVPCFSRYDIGFAPPIAAEADVALYTITTPNAVSPRVTSVRTCQAGVRLFTSEQVRHQPPELLAPLLEVPVLVVARAGRRE